MREIEAVTRRNRRRKRALEPSLNLRGCGPRVRRPDGPWPAQGVIPTGLRRSGRYVDPSAKYNVSLLQDFYTRNLISLRIPTPLPDPVHLDVYHLSTFLHNVL